MLNNSLLWYTTRAAGVVSLILLSAVMVLGILARKRVTTRSWPAFLSAALHRNLTLVTLVFLALHVITAVVDPFTHLGPGAALVPFSSSYRTVWLGLGAVAVELLLAVAATSALRAHVGPRIWRTAHWLAYGCWPVAVLHGLGTGTDTRSLWSLGVTGTCALAVATAIATRLHYAPANPLAGRVQDSLFPASRVRASR